MPTRKRLCLFLASSALVYLALLSLWPFVSHAYATSFRAMGNCLAGEDYPRFITYLQIGEAHHDTELRVVNRTGGRTEINLSSRGHGFMPTILVVALTSTFPRAWMRRVLATLWGLFWTNVYIASKLAMFPVIYSSSANSASRVATLSAGMFQQGLWVIGNSSVGWMIVPLVISTTIILRNADFKSVDACDLSR